MVARKINFSWVVAITIIGQNLHPVALNPPWYSFVWTEALETLLTNLNWPYLFIAWVLTPCYRSKNVLEFSLESIGINKSFMVGGCKTNFNVCSRSIHLKVELFLTWLDELSSTLTGPWPGARQFLSLFMYTCHHLCWWIQEHVLVGLEYSWMSLFWYQLEIVHSICQSSCGYCKQEYLVPASM